MSLPRKNVSTDKDEWRTPLWLWEMLRDEYDLRFDVACTPENCLVSRFMGADTLKIPWTARFGKGGFFGNFPYSAGKIDAFAEKAQRESLLGARVVCLVKVSTDTNWWHDYMMRAYMIRFIRGRVDYVGHDLQGNIIRQTPPFATCVVIFDDKKRNTLQESMPCGLDDPCDEAYILEPGQRCSHGWDGCANPDYDGTFPLIGPTIEKPKKRSGNVKNQA